MAKTTARATRETILDAADRLMARNGFRKTTMEDVAREAGVGRRTLYVHFKNKEDLGLSSIGRVVQQVHDDLRLIVDSDDRAVERVRRLLAQRVLGRVERIQDYYHSLDELFEVVRPGYLARRRSAFEVELEMLTQVLTEGRAAGELQFADAVATGRAMLLATNAFLPYSLSVRELGELDEIRARVAEMIDLLLAGVSTAKS